MIVINSEERRELRYQRRKARRDCKRRMQFVSLGTYDTVFSYKSLYAAFYKCCKGVRWKGSIQRYEATVPLSAYHTFEIMRKRKFEPMGFDEFTIFERGKARYIRAVRIQERCVQRALCDNYLNPVLQSKLIYDNGACIKGKGVDFTLNRLKEHLHRYYRKNHTNNGYIFQYDFSSYFDNIDHDRLLCLLRKEIADTDIFNVVKSMIQCFGAKGLGLGSQVSQICAVYYPTLLDMYFKHYLRCKLYGRYMDDGYVICRTKQEANRCKRALFDICAMLGITVNERKVRVSKISRTFTFLKKRIFMTDTGQIVMRSARETLTRARQRLKKMAVMVAVRKRGMTIKHFMDIYKGYSGMLRRYKNYAGVQSFRDLYLRLYRTLRWQYGFRDDCAA